MRRGELWHALWNASWATLPPASAISIAGAGISGLHLAYAFAKAGLNVTVYDPKRRGGLRIPLMHACNLRTPGTALWQKARDFALSWYTKPEFQNAVLRHEGNFGSYFSIHTPNYLSQLRLLAKKAGVQFVNTEAPQPLDIPLFIATGIAAGRNAPARWQTALFPLLGYESYFGIRAGSQPAPPALTLSDVRTNYFVHGRRAAFIHRNSTQRKAAIEFARRLHPRERHILCSGVRLTTQDRLPVVGYAIPEYISDYNALRTLALQVDLCSLFAGDEKIFYFTGMGYHAMTYAPYLAEQVALWLTGKTEKKENLLGMLTPARFLPR